MVSNSLIYIVLLLFAFKLIANFEGFYKLYKDAQTNPNASMSMLWEMEVALLIIAIILSTLSSGDSLVNRPLSVAGWGFLAMIGSYVMIYIMVLILGIFSYLFRKKKVNIEDTDSLE